MCSLNPVLSYGVSKDLIRCADTIPSVNRSKGIELNTVASFADNVILDSPFDQFQNPNPIPDMYYSLIKKTESENGQTVEVDVVITDHKKNDECAGNGCISQTSRRKQTLVPFLENYVVDNPPRIQGEFSGEVEPVGEQLVISKPEVNVISSKYTDYTHTELEVIFKNFLKDTRPADDPLTEESVNYILKTLIKNIEYVENEVLSYYLKKRGGLDKATGKSISPQQTIRLSNVGINRYFWFKPDGTGVHLPGRVLDIHEEDGLSFLIEWIVPDQGDAGSVRFVTTLLLEETSSLFIDKGSFSRLAAMESFEKMLSPNEIFAVRLAEKLNVHTFGYANMFRGVSGVYTSRNDPLNQMSTVGHLAILQFVRDNFPNYKEYLTKEELEMENSSGKGYINIIDVFSRIPATVFFRDIALANSNIEYTWVIIEGGQIKISPHMHKGNNLKHQVLRLAHGRRIYAGGSMVIDDFGGVHLTLKSNGYQSSDFNWGGSQSFNTASNGDVYTLDSLRNSKFPQPIV